MYSSNQPGATHGVEYFTITNVTAAGAGNWMVGMSNAGGTKPVTFTLSLQNPNMEGLELIQHGIQDTFEENGLWIQCGANAMQHIIVNRYDCRSVALGISAVSTQSITTMTQSLVNLDQAFDTINNFRALAGAQQNRMEHTVNALGISSMNLSASESRIRDADMGKEMMNLTKAQVLSQAAVSMIAQANSSTETVVSLLRR